MGLAASQAKLLSITSRLSDNEMRSQTVTAAKLALAGQTSEASRKYRNALNQNEYIYRTYDENGDKVYVDLTAAQLSNYGPLKNQYALVNPDGQVLVSELDGANYENSRNINEFLDKYGIAPIPTGVTQTVENPAYSDAYTKWAEEHARWAESEPSEYIDKLVSPAWTEVIPGKTVTNDDAWTEVVQEAYTERIDTTGWWNRIMQTGCINFTMEGKNCWMHVVSSLLGEGDHTTTGGDTFHVYDGSCEHGEKWCWNTDQHPVSDQLKEDLKHEYACGHVHDEYVDMPLGDGTTYRAWCKDDDCSEGMTVYQKLVDMLWEYHDDYQIGSATGGPSNPEHVATFWHIVNFDLCKWEEVEHPEVTVEHPATTSVLPDEYIEHEAVYERVENPAYQEWLEKEPVMQDIPETIDEEIYTYADSDKAQWYVNLWHRMNGPSQKKDGIMTTTTTTNVTTTEYGTTSLLPSTTVTTTKTGPKWKVLEDGLYNSQDWLKYALETGLVSMERVNYTNPTEYGTGLKYATWTSIIYTNALDISEQSDEEAIAKTEAEYEQKTKEIEAKEKQYDSILKLLDTEHSALQQEYESAKAVITKNTERTLKMYSA